MLPIMLGSSLVSLTVMLRPYPSLAKTVLPRPQSSHTRMWPSGACGNACSPCSFKVSGLLGLGGCEGILWRLAAACSSRFSKFRVLVNVSRAQQWPAIWILPVSTDFACVCLCGFVLAALAAAQSRKVEG